MPNDVRTDFKGDTKDLKAKAAEAKATLQDFEKQAETSIGEGANRSFKKLGEGIGEATSGVRKLTSAVTGTVGVFTAWVGVLTLAATVAARVAEKVKLAREETTLYKTELDGIKDATKAAAKQLEEFGKTSFSTENLDRIRERVEKADQQLRVLQERLARASSVLEKDTRDRLNRQIEKLEESVRDDRKILDRVNRELRESKEQAAKEKADAEELLRIEKERASKEKAQKDQRDQEAALQNAKDQGDAAVEAFRQQQRDDQRRNDEEQLDALRKYNEEQKAAAAEAKRARAEAIRDAERLLDITRRIREENERSAQAQVTGTGVGAIGAFNDFWKVGRGSGSGSRF